MVDKVKFARWATKEEVQSFYSYVNSKNKDKASFTKIWLSKYGDDFISYHESYPNDCEEHLRSQDGKRYKEAVFDYDDTLSSPCYCGGKTRIVNGQYGEFIGCDNFRDTTQKHVMKSRPIKWARNDYNDRIYTSTYLVRIKQMYNLPKDLKISLLYEYLLLRNIKPHFEMGNRLNIVADASKKSKNRESIVSPILKTKFDKVYHQKMIKAYYEKGECKTFIPDFICLKNGNCYLFEQKKSIQNIDNSQLRTYIECLNFMMPENMKLKTYVIIENEKDDESYNDYVESSLAENNIFILTLNEIITNELN